MDTNIPSKDKSSKKGTFGALGISIAAHAAIFLVFGSIIIFEGVIPKTPFTAYDIFAGGAPEQADVPELVDDTDVPDMSPDVPQLDDLSEPTVDTVPTNTAVDVLTTTAANSPFSMISSPTAVVGPEAAVGPARKSSGSGKMGAGDTKKLVRNIFGIKMEAKHLGVLLDVSGSAHPVLPVAIEEIEKNFDDAIVVLAFGCGISPSVKSSDVDVKVFGSMKPDKDKDRPGSRTTLGQIAQAELKFKDVEKIMDRYRKRDDVWVIYGGDNKATYYGFEKLIDQGVDAIYWFADFQDAVDKKEADDLIKKLKSRGIKVYLHNFAGVSFKDKPVQAAFAAETGGDTIVGKTK